jgi:subtilase family serine protease
LSLYESKPSYQYAIAGSKRGTPDVAFNSDPYTGFYVYDTVAYWGISGWFQEAGTSAAAPQWAALIALADQGRALLGKGSLANGQALIYNLPASDFHDITTGSNGFAASPGYDLATGRGTPNARLLVQHLVSMGTLTVLPVMAPSHATTLSSPQPFFAGKPALGSISTILGTDPSLIQSQQEFWTKTSPTSLIERKDRGEESSIQSSPRREELASLVKWSIPASEDMWTILREHDLEFLFSN